MKILFVASEVAPFAKTGGLADVTGSLPKELKRMGHDVRIVLPFYRDVGKSKVSVASTGVAADIGCGPAIFRVELFETATGDVPVYLVGNSLFSDRDFLYGTPVGDYPDNDIRFALFCRGALKLVENIGFQPDILHCHDWQTAPIPILLTHERDVWTFFNRTAVVYTIHNLGYQGLFPRESLAEMGLSPDLFTMDLLEFYGKVNLMKGAILTADLINTVSETYCGEILTAEQGCGLEGVLKGRETDLSGIVNGIDYGDWDPEIDRDIFRNFSVADPAGKGENKARLQQLLGFEQSADIPLLGVVSRLSEQKGFDLVAEMLSGFRKRALQLVILGDGEEKFVRLITAAAGPKAGNISFRVGFELALARRIYAGCDMFLMPSRYEPCGLGQLIALRYGAVPVVRKTGGLADTVFDPKESAEPNGFSFTEYTAAALKAALARAVKAWKNKDYWRELVQRGMSADFSWRASALRYEELYRRAVEKKRA
jgi:starch synthase